MKHLKKFGELNEKVYPPSIHNGKQMYEELPGEDYDMADYFIYEFLNGEGSDDKYWNNDYTAVFPFEVVENFGFDLKDLDEKYPPDYYDIDVDVDFRNKRVIVKTEAEFHQRKKTKKIR